MSKHSVYGGLAALIQDDCFSSEELDLLMQRLMEESEQDSMDIIASWERKSRNVRQNSSRDQ